MNTDHTNEHLNGKPTFANRCAQSCRHLLAGIEQTKNRIASDFQEALESQEKLFQLALNEAEALAWQTGYPHLVFPALAMEKVESVAAWHARQQSLYRRRTSFAETI